MDKTFQDWSNPHHLKYYKNALQKVIVIIVFDPQKHVHIHHAVIIGVVPDSKG